MPLMGSLGWRRRDKVTRSEVPMDNEEGAAVHVLDTWWRAEHLDTFWLCVSRTSGAESRNDEHRSGSLFAIVSEEVQVEEERGEGAAPKRME